MIEFKGSHFEREVILWGLRWYVSRRLAMIDRLPLQTVSSVSQTRVHRAAPSA
jgi:hypothetical protein